MQTGEARGDGGVFFWLGGFGGEVVVGEGVEAEGWWLVGVEWEGSSWWVGGLEVGCWDGGHFEGWVLEVSWLWRWVGVVVVCRASRLLLKLVYDGER